MSDRYFNNFKDFNDDFDDDFEDDDFLDASDNNAEGIEAEGIEGDRNSAGLNPFIQEIEQVPPEHRANLLQMIRLFRQSVALAEQNAKAEAQSPPIQPTVLLPVKPIDTTPTEPTPTEPIPADATSIDSNVAPTDPIDKLLRRSQFESSSDRPPEQVSPPAEPLQDPPLIPLRLPRTSEAEVESVAEPTIEVAESAVEYGGKPTSTEDESDWDELMDFLDQDTPKDFREENDSRDNDWDEYFRPSP